PGERPRFLFALHPSFAQRFLCSWCPWPGIEAERQRLGNRFSHVDRSARVKDHIAILGAELDLFVAVLTFVWGCEQNLERLVDRRPDRFPAGNAALRDLRLHTAARLHHVAGARNTESGGEMIDSFKGKSPGQGGTLRRICLDLQSARRWADGIDPHGTAELTRFAHRLGSSPAINAWLVAAFSP